jgi:hypothetical protein
MRVHDAANFHHGPLECHAHPRVPHLRRGLVQCPARARICHRNISRPISSRTQSERGSVVADTCACEKISRRSPFPDDSIDLHVKPRIVMEHLFDPRAAFLARSRARCVRAGRTCSRCAARQQGKPFAASRLERGCRRAGRSPICNHPRTMTTRIVSQGISRDVRLGFRHRAAISSRRADRLFTEIYVIDDLSQESARNTSRCSSSRKPEPAPSHGTSR